MRNLQSTVTNIVLPNEPISGKFRSSDGEQLLVSMRAPKRRLFDRVALYGSSDGMLVKEWNARFDQAFGDGADWFPFRSDVIVFPSAKEKRRGLGFANASLVQTVDTTTGEVLGRIDGEDISSEEIIVGAMNESMIAVANCNGVGTMRVLH